VIELELSGFTHGSLGSLNIGMIGNRHKLMKLSDNTSHNSERTRFNVERGQLRSLIEDILGTKIEKLLLQ